MKLLLLFILTTIVVNIATAQRDPPHKQTMNSASRRRLEEGERLVVEGMSYVKTNPAKAIATFQKAKTIVLVPDDVLRGIALAKEVQGDKIGAYQAWKEMLGEDPKRKWHSTLQEEAMLWAKFALCALDVGKNYEAEMISKKAVYLWNTKSHGSQPKITLQAVKQDANSIRATSYLVLGLGSQKYDDLAKAKDYLRKAINISKGDLKMFAETKLKQLH
jgi:tetratricopeptide (TPR) repeat protein